MRLEILDKNQFQQLELLGKFKREPIEWIIKPVSAAAIQNRLIKLSVHE